MSKIAALTSAALIVLTGIARAQGDDGIDKRIQRLREALDKKLNELDREKERVKGEFERELKRFAEPERARKAGPERPQPERLRRPEAPPPPERLQRRPERPQPQEGFDRELPRPFNPEAILQRVAQSLKRFEGMLQNMERRLRALEDGVPDGRRMRGPRFEPEEGQDRIIERFEFRVPPSERMDQERGPRLLERLRMFRDGPPGGDQRMERFEFRLPAPGRMRQERGLRLPERLRAFRDGPREGVREEIERRVFRRGPRERTEDERPQ